MPESYSQITVRLPSLLYNELKEEATANGETVHHYVISLIKLQLGNCREQAINGAKEGASALHKDP